MALKFSSIWLLRENDIPSRNLRLNGVECILLYLFVKLHACSICYAIQAFPFILIGFYFSGSSLLDFSVSWRNELACLMSAFVMFFPRNRRVFPISTQLTRTQRQFSLAFTLNSTVWYKLGVKGHISLHVIVCCY